MKKLVSSIMMIGQSNRALSFTQNKFQYLLLTLVSSVLLALSPTVMAQTNVAQGKPTQQSSTLANAYNPTADKAVDGNTDGNFPGSSVTSTNNENRPWWRVDLQGDYNISRIEIYNRTDCCGERLSNFDVLISQDMTNWRPFYVQGTVGATQAFTINAPARWVQVMMRGVGMLSLAEVKVFADPSAAYTYRMRHKISKTNLCQYDFGKSSSHNVGVYPEDASDGVKWRFQDAGDGYFYITYKVNYWALSVSSDNVQNNYVANHPMANSDAQKWKMERLPNGYYTFKNKFRPDVALTVYDFGTSNHREGTVWPHGGVLGDAFQWSLEPVDVKAPAPNNVASTTPNATKLELLTTYAPQVWLAPGEEYFPTSTEWAFKSLFRAINPEGLPALRTIRPVEGSDDGDPLFKGNDGQPFTAGVKAPVYAFWSENAAGVNLVYNFYYTYNRGKKVLGSVYGNHVGDWEHITVRLEKSNQTWVPTKVYYSSHDKGELIAWSNVQKIADTHPIVFSAWGSHGCYSTGGSTEYDTAAGTPLVDVRGNGTQWQTWMNLVALDYNAQARLNPPAGQDGASAYPLWMGRGARNASGGVDYFWIPDAFIVRGGAFSYLRQGTLWNPWAGPVHRWGNPELKSGGDAITSIISGSAVRLTDGPGGPQDKDIWGVNLN